MSVIAIESNAVVFFYSLGPAKIINTILNLSHEM